MLRKIRVLLLKISILLYLCVWAFGQEKIENKIISPRSGYPLIAEQGKQIPIKIYLTSFQYKNMEAKLISCGEEDQRHYLSLKIQRVDRAGNEITIFFAGDKNIPLDLYHLLVEVKYNESKITLEEERCIKIIDKYKHDFYFMVLSDIHLAEKEIFFSTPNVEKVKRIIKEVNLLGPEFVVICGDIVDGYDYDKEYELVKKIFADLQVPTFIIPGNHDTYYITVRKQRKMLNQDGKVYFQKYIGDLHYTVNYGNFKMLMINTFDKLPEKRTLIFYQGGISSSQFNFIEDQLRRWGKGQKNLFIHHSIHDKEWEEEDWNKIYNLIKDYKVDYVFSGHEHQDRIIKEEATTFVWNTSAGGGMDADLVKEGRKGYEGYRKIYVKNNQIASLNYEEPQYSYPAYQIDFSKENNEYIFKNNLKEDITANFKVILPKDKKIKNKEVNILQKVEIPPKIRYATSSQSCSKKYYLQTDVKANTEKRIKLYD